MTMETTARDPLAIAENWHGEGRTVAIATVIETWGFRWLRRRCRDHRSA